MAKLERTDALYSWSILFLAVLPAVLAHEFMVGDAQGWTAPINNKDVYEDWSSKQTFVVNDTLRFKYTEGRHNVLVVAKSDYDACFNQTPIERHTDGDTRIQLNRSGTWYFMCGFPGHCDAGQKFSASVKNASLTGSVSESHANVGACFFSSVVLASLGLFWTSLCF